MPNELTELEKIDIDKLNYIKVYLRLASLNFKTQMELKSLLMASTYQLKVSKNAVNFKNRHKTSLLLIIYTMLFQDRQHNILLPKTAPTQAQNPHTRREAHTWGS